MTVKCLLRCLIVFFKPLFVKTYTRFTFIVTPFSRPSDWGDQFHKQISEEKKPPPFPTVGINVMTLFIPLSEFMRNVPPFSILLKLESGVHTKTSVNKVIINVHQ